MGDTNEKDDDHVVVDDDLSLRSPLGPLHLAVEKIFCGTHDQCIRSQLHGLLVGANFLCLSMETRYAAAVLLHRYCLATAGLNSYSDDDDTNDDEKNHHKKNEWKYRICACLFLAAKQNEELRRLRDVVNLIHNLDCHKNIVYWDNETFVPDPKARQKILETERRVLLFLRFDVVVSRPHRAVILLLNDFTKRQPPPLPPMNNVEELQNAAFTLINNTVYSVLALQMPVLALAAAAICVAMVQSETYFVHAKRALVSWCSLATQLPFSMIESAYECLQCVQENLQTTNKHDVYRNM
jgi:hypothetical protein